MMRASGGTVDMRIHGLDVPAEPVVGNASLPETVLLTTRDLRTPTPIYQIAIYYRIFFFPAEIAGAAVHIAFTRNTSPRP